MKQLLSGIFFLHRNNILHRDIKASNLLISQEGVLKLADFGLARPVISEPGLEYTNNVITLWYRPPELLLGEERYGPAVDIWSAGCIMAELLLKKPLFPGKTEFDQLALIWDALGDKLPSWPEATKTAKWSAMRPAGPPKHPLRDKFANLPLFDRDKFPKSADNAIALLEAMLALDPKKRITAQAALDSDWFWSGPETMKPSDLPRYPPIHEWTAKKKRQASVPGPALPSGSHHSSHSAPNGQVYVRQSHQSQPRHSDPEMQAPAAKRLKPTEAPK